MSDGPTETPRQKLPPEIQAQIERQLEVMRGLHAKHHHELTKRYEPFRRNRALAGEHVGHQWAFIMQELARCFAAVEMTGMSMQDAVMELNATASAMAGKQENRPTAEPPPSAL